VTRIVDDYYDDTRLDELVERSSLGTPGARMLRDRIHRADAKRITQPRLIGQNCTIVATDVVGFGAGARTDEDRLVIRAASTAMTEAAFKTIWSECGWQDRGDGLIVIIPPDTSTAAVIGSLLTALPAALAEHNSEHEPGARIQLRVSVHVGPVVADANGLTGDAIIEAARMLNAAPFRDAVADKAPALGLITSSFVFETAIRNGGLLEDRRWTPVETTVKERQLTAWYHLLRPNALRRFAASAREATREATLSLSVKLNVEIGIRAVYADQRPRLIGQNCTIVATDVVSFGASARTDEDRLVIRAATTAMTEAAFDAVWSECSLQDCGDGLVVVIPPATTTAEVVTKLLTALPAALEQHNAAERPGARVQLRVAIDVGPVFEDANGLSGDAIIATTRMLNAAPFQDAVAEDAPALAMITSPFVFHSAVRNGGLLGDERWTRVEATVKERRLTAWYHLIQPWRSARTTYA
jgi:class 3 adenylate cyclase/heat shock protein HspQ